MSCVTADKPYDLSEQCPRPQMQTIFCLTGIRFTALHRRLHELSEGFKQSRTGLQGLRPLPTLRSSSGFQRSPFSLDLCPFPSFLILPDFIYLLIFTSEMEPRVSCMIKCAGEFSVNLTQPGSSGKRDPHLGKCLHQTGM